MISLRPTSPYVIFKALHVRAQTFLFAPKMHPVLSQLYAFICAFGGPWKTMFPFSFSTPFTTFKTWFQYYLRVNTSLNLPELIELSQQWVNSSVPGSTMPYYHYFISHNYHYILYHIIILFSPDCKLHEDRDAISPSSASLPLPQIHRPVLTSNVHPKLSRNALLSTFPLDILRGETINYWEIYTYIFLFLSCYPEWWQHKALLIYIA